MINKCYGVKQMASNHERGGLKHCPYFRNQPTNITPIQLVDPLSRLQPLPLDHQYALLTLPMALIIAIVSFVSTHATCIKLNNQSLCHATFIGLVTPLHATCPYLYSFSWLVPCVQQVSQPTNCPILYNLQLLMPRVMLLLCQQPFA